MMFKKVLVANRGEIALRVIRACHEMDIEAVAVYSEADRDSLHVKAADEAVCIGPGPAAQSYLNIPNIISAAEVSGADAVHPGYGFLAENDKFADMSNDCEMVFIGPSGEAIRQLGDKAKAKEIMAAGGVPVIPGSDGPIEGESGAQRIAAEIGYPVIVKASAGGGGRGMRVVQNEHELAAAMAMARSEAQAAFGNPEVYMEKYIEEPRHIEVQILGDTQGNLIHLFERDCSIQRRHQKLLEEAPSIFLKDDLREKLGATAIKAAKAASYHSAGTVEFLVDKHGKFYFMEMNTRIQVEHPVTEMVTGIDLVKEQIRISAGERLDLKQSDVRVSGHAIEMRINAEDPDHGFRPAGGKIELYNAPGGPGVRVDTHIYTGYVIPSFYDSLLAKIIVWGRDRDEAIARAGRALGELVIVGPPTTADFHKRIIENAFFRKGEVYTNFVARRILSE